MSRLGDLETFYRLLDVLKASEGGYRYLNTANGRMSWPARGVYFFFEEGENRSDSGSGGRVVRVGTHALTEGSRTTLWNRLSQHKGVARTGGGNHRGSIFRLLVGTALMAHDSSSKVPSWGKGSSAGRDTREAEEKLEKAVSETIGAMPFLWLNVDDAPGKESKRSIIERNAIALLSNYCKQPLDPPSKGWLGYHCDREKVRLSGLWNQNHVDDSYDPGFLQVLEEMLRQAHG